MRSRAVTMLRWVRRQPVTALFLAVAIGLHAAVLVYEWRNPERAEDAFWALGAVSHLMRVADPDLHGPFDLWDGQWWRILVSGFHHANLLHLLFNGLSLAYLGELLEPRMRWWRYLLFLLAALMVSLLPEYLLGDIPIGLSGMICAMFGMLVVVRRHDEEIAERLPQSAVRMTIAVLFAMVPLTWLGIVPIANVAHFSGLAYGWVAGRVWFGEVPRPAARRAFLAAHVLLVPATFLVMRPAWNGRYHWYLAERPESGAERIVHLQNAVECDPGLPRVWLRLAAHRRADGRLLAAWEAILAGLSHNRSNEELLHAAQIVWLQLRSEERGEALDTIERVFGEESLAWQSRLGVGSELAGDLGQPFPSDDVVFDEQRYSLEQRIVLPPALDGSDALPLHEQQLPPIDPNHPQSAAEGVML